MSHDLDKKKSTMAPEHTMQRKTIAIQVVWLGLLSVRHVSTTEIKYVGCMTPESEARKEPTLELLEEPTKEERQRLSYLARKRGPFSHLVGEFSGMTVQVCVQRCWMFRNEFAALQAAQHCFCANTVDGLTIMDASRCYDRCSGNCLQRCGGAVALSVYTTGYEKEPPYPEGLIEKVRKRYRYCIKHRSEPDPFCLKTTARLYSPRMSPLICISYCSNQSMYWATLKDEYTCCCAKFGRRFLYSYTVDSERCSLPCSGGEPRCIGRSYDKKLSAVFDVLKTYSLGTSTNFDRHADWLRPKWPVNETFEHEEYKPRYVSPEEAEKQQQQAKQQDLVVDTVNAGVQVVDEPEEEESSSTGMMAGVIVCCAVLVVGIIGTIHHNKNKSPETFKLPDNIPQKISADDEDTVEKIKSKKKKKKKKRKKKKRSKSEDDKKKSKTSNKDSSQNSLLVDRTDRFFVDSYGDRSTSSDSNNSQTAFISRTEELPSHVDSYSNSSRYSDNSQTTFISRTEELPSHVDPYSDSSRYSDDSQTAFISRTKEFPFFVHSYSDSSRYSDDSQKALISQIEKFPFRGHY